MLKWNVQICQLSFMGFWPLHVAYWRSMWMANFFLHECIYVYLVEQYWVWGWSNLALKVANPLILVTLLKKKWQNIYIELLRDKKKLMQVISPCGFTFLSLIQLFAISLQKQWLCLFNQANISTDGSEHFL